MVLNARRQSFCSIQTAATSSRVTVASSAIWTTRISPSERDLRRMLSRHCPVSILENHLIVSSSGDLP